MAIVAQKKPEAIKRPVQITETKYEMWYAKPVCLGEINKIGKYWYTADHMRFVSSRDALEYLIRVSESATSGELPKPVPAPKPVVLKKKEAIRSPEVQVNQTHPLFSQFIEWVDTMGKEKALRLASKQARNGEQHHGK